MSLIPVHPSEIPIRLHRPVLCCRRTRVSSTLRSTLSNRQWCVIGLKFQRTYRPSTITLSIKTATGRMIPMLQPTS